VLFDLVFFRAMDDAHILTQQSDAAAFRDHRDVTGRAFLQIVQHVLLGEGSAGFIVLHVIFSENSREFSGVGGDQGPVSVFEEFQDLLLVGFQPPASFLGRFSLPSS